MHTHALTPNFATGVALLVPQYPRSEPSPRPRGGGRMIPIVALPLVRSPHLLPKRTLRKRMYLLFWPISSFPSFSSHLPFNLQFRLPSTHTPAPIHTARKFALRFTCNSKSVPFMKKPGRVSLRNEGRRGDYVVEFIDSSAGWLELRMVIINFKKVENRIKNWKIFKTKFLSGSQQLQEKL